MTGFTQYIEEITQNIRAARSRDYQGAKLEQVTRMSAPFELKITPNPKKGILLTHGFLSSPYIMKSLGEDFAKADFLVRAILLPGHGTYYQDLDNYTWQDWMSAVRFGYDSLTQDCEEIYLCGFSIGATLSLMIALDEINNANSKLKKIILLAPCFGISPFAQSFPLLIKTKLNKFLPQLFCTQAEPEHLGSYKQFSLYSVSQIVLLLKSLNKKLSAYQEHKFPLPTYVAASGEDATVKFAPILNFVNTYLNQNSYFRIYSNKNIALPKTVPSILISAKSFNKNIVAISHVAIPVSPQDAYFGINGSYYGQLPTNTCFGEPHLTRGIKRLTYNPDYQNLQQQIFTWINENDSHLQQK